MAKILRIRLRSFDAALIDTAAKAIVEAAKKGGVRVAGPVPLPTKKSLFTVLRSPHVHKKSREQFFLTIHKRLIDIYNPTKEAVEPLNNIELPAGVDVEVSTIDK